MVVLLNLGLQDRGIEVGPCFNPCYIAEVALENIREVLSAELIRL